MKSKKTNVLGVHIDNFETYSRYSEISGLRRWLPFKLSERGDLKKDFGKPWFK